MIHSASYVLIELLCALLLLAGCSKDRYDNLKPQRMVLREELLQPTAAAPPTKELLSISNPGRHARVTADLEQAPALLVLEELLAASGRAYIFERVDHVDPVTVHLCDIPIDAAIAEIVKQSSLRLESKRRDGQELWYICDTVGTSIGKSSQFISRSFSPTYASVNNLMSSLFTTKGLWSGKSSLVQVAASEESNQMFIRGPENDVRATLQMLQAADQPNSEIVIDTYFILIDKALANQLALKIDLQAGPWSLTGIGNQLGTDFAGTNILSGTVNALFSESVRYPLLLKNTLADSLLALVQEDASARISRGEIHVASGQSAQIHVGNIGYILMTSFSRDVPSVSQRSIKTGLMLSVTPQALPGGLIRLKVGYEDSAFSPVANLAANKQTNKSEAVLQVASGQPLLIGGVMRHENSSQNVGYRHLHSIPVLNALSAADSEERSAYHAAFVIVPRISFESHGISGIPQMYSNALQGDATP